MPERTAKATDLKNWYQIKEETKTNKGERIACIAIIRSNLIRI
jgi:hypothetical protein